MELIRFYSLNEHRLHTQDAERYNGPYRLLSIAWPLHDEHLAIAEGNSMDHCVASVCREQSPSAES